MKIRKPLTNNLDLILATFTSIGIGVILGRYAIGGPLSTDVLYYMNSGLNHVENVFILNRYFHIFMEAWFLKAAPTPLVGFQYYWAFLITATALLIYYNARSFTEKSNFVHGILAVGLFFSVQFLSTIAGIAWVDLAAMLLVMINITVFMASVRRQHQSKWLLVLLGLLFFLAFKTKETTIISGLVFIGLGFSEGKFEFREFWNRIIYVLIGLMAGIFVFAILSWVMLGDPLFGLRPREIYGFITSYVHTTTGQAQEQAAAGNWYTAYLLQPIYIPFILFILSGLMKGTDLDPSRRLLWWLPLGLTVFVSLSASTSWGPRFLMPAIPPICFLGPQFLDFEIPNSARERMVASVFFFTGIALLVLIRFMMRYVLPRIGWDTNLFLNTIFEPGVLSIILAIAFFWRRLSLKLSIIIGVLLLAVLTSPLIYTYKTMIRDHPNQALSQAMFYPFSTFSAEIHYTPNMKMLVSLNSWKEVGMPDYAKNIDEVLDIFNVYFDAASDRSNYTIVTKASEISQDLLQSDYSYAVIAMEDWQSISTNSAVKASLEEKYHVIFEPKDLVVLLLAK